MFRARRRIRKHTDGRTARRCVPFLLETLEPRRLLTTYTVDNAQDSGAGSLRAAILAADGDPSPGTDEIVFNIPAAETGELSTPFPGFDSGTQDWTITLDSPLPAITRSLSIDGYTQANPGDPAMFQYPDSITSAVQIVEVAATGGSFTLTTSSPLPAATTQAIPYDATAAQIQAALVAILGADNVDVTGGPADSGGVIVSFEGSYGQEAIPDMIATGSLTPANSTVNVETSTVGGSSKAPPRSHRLRTRLDPPTHSAAITHRSA